jgi:pimeloyl-ACP methyl ester carboxylesterase
MAELMENDMNKHYDLKSPLKNYKGQCIVIRTRQDIIPDEVSFQIRDILSQTKFYCIEKCGHMAFLEQPDEFYKILREGLAEK